MYGAAASSHQEGNGENSETRLCSPHPLGSGRTAERVDNGVSVVHKEILLSVVSWFVPNATWGCEKDVRLLKFEFLPSATTSTGLSGRLSACRNRSESFTAFLAAEIIRLPITFGVKSGLFIHGHAADRVFGNDL